MLRIIKDNPDVLLLNLSERKEILLKEFHSMCYICEEATRHTQEDHFFPKKKYPEKEMEWTNLFLICQKCNQIKGARYNVPGKEILNVLFDDVENLISLSLEGNQIRIDTVSTGNSELDIKTENTNELLNSVYNTESMSSIQLRQILKNEVKEFSDIYLKYQMSGNKYQEGFFYSLQERLSKIKA